MNYGCLMYSNLMLFTTLCPLYASVLLQLDHHTHCPPVTPTPTCNKCSGSFWLPACLDVLGQCRLSSKYLAPSWLTWPLWPVLKRPANWIILLLQLYMFLHPDTQCKDPEEKTQLRAAMMSAAWFNLDGFTTNATQTQIESSQSTYERDVS